jgi:hypothetical protein
MYDAANKVLNKSSWRGGGGLINFYVKSSFLMTSAEFTIRLEYWKVALRVKRVECNEGEGVVWFEFFVEKGTLCGSSLGKHPVLKRK